MKVLVTGGAGFIGSHLVEHLDSLGHFVKAVAHYRGDGSCGWLDHAQVKRVVVLPGDVRDPLWVRQAAEGADWIFHLAAQAGIPHSYASPEQFVATNTVGTLNVLEAARAHGCRMLHMSTSEVYGTAQYTPMDEDHPTLPQSPYAASKLGAEALCHSYRLSYGLDVRVVRSFNVTGPRQSLRAVIPNVLGQMLRAKYAGHSEVEVHVGTLDARRDFTYVKDNVRALVKVMELDSMLVDVFNVASGKSIAIGELVQLCAEVLEMRATPVVAPEYVRPAASEVQNLCGGAHWLHAHTGWRPEIKLRDAIREISEWLVGRDLREGMIE